MSRPVLYPEAANLTKHEAYIERVWDDLADLFSSARGAGADIPAALRSTFAVAVKKLRVYKDRNRVRRSDSPPQPIPNLSALIETIAPHHGTTVAAVMGPSRRRKPSDARAEVWLVLRFCRVPLAAIAAAFERADHTTVLKTCQRHEQNGGAELRARVAWLAGQWRAGARVEGRAV